MIIKGSIHIGQFIYIRSHSIDEDTVNDVRVYADSGEYIVQKCIQASETKGGGVWEVTSSPHNRLHEITNPLDHAPDIENKGKIIILEETQGKPTFIDVEGEEVEGVGKPIIVEKDYENKKITIKLDESKVDHNKLLNYEEDRHREMNYSDVLKSYLIKP